MVFNDLFLAFWFFLPAAFANVTPILVAPLPVLSHWNTPIDGGKTWREKRILGSHKTWRGFFFGVGIAMIVCWLQGIAYEESMWLRDHLDMDYTLENTLVLGAMLGAGALLGDAVESFFKRQIGVRPGKVWFPWDQLDYILGALFMSLFAVILPWGAYVWIFCLWFVMHLLFSVIGYFLKLKDSPI